MKITVNKKELPIKIMRKLKLLKISEKEVNVPSNFDWKMDYENFDEHFEDFQIFCLSIAKDLLSNGIQTNEIGIVKYEIVKNETTLQDIQNLILILEEKNKK